MTDNGLDIEKCLHTESVSEMLGGFRDEPVGPSCPVAESNRNLDTGGKPFALPINESRECEGLVKGQESIGGARCTSASNEIERCTADRMEEMLIGGYSTGEQQQWGGHAPARLLFSCVFRESTTVSSHWSICIAHGARSPLQCSVCTSNTHGGSTQPLYGLTHNRQTAALLLNQCFVAQLQQCPGEFRSVPSPQAATIVP